MKTASPSWLQAGLVLGTRSWVVLVDEEGEVFMSGLEASLNIHWDSCFLSLCLRATLRAFSVLSLSMGAAVCVYGCTFSVCFLVRARASILLLYVPLGPFALFTPSLQFHFLHIPFSDFLLFPLLRNNTKWKFIFYLFHWLGTILCLLLIYKSQ